MKATDLNNSFDSLPAHIVRLQAKHYLDKCNSYKKHEIGVISIFVFEHCSVSVNKESLKIIFFDSEEEAVNYYLDRFNGTKEIKQGQLF